MGRFFILLSVALSGCLGQIGDSAVQSPDQAPPGVAPPPSTEPPPPVTPPDDTAPADPWTGLHPSSAVGMRRLTNVEIEAAVTDLVGEPIGFTDGFPPEERVGGFENNAAALTFPPTLTERAFDAARRAAERVANRAETFAACAANQRNRTCAETFLRSFADRAWRRSVTDTELVRLLSVYDVGTQQENFTLGITLAVQATLLSAPFYYLIEDERTEAKPGYTVLDGAERASRLAFFLWRAPPDAALRAAAAAGDLDTAAGVRAQAERLLASPLAERSITEFHRQWLALDRVAEVNKDPVYFPTWDDDLPAKMRSELDRYLAQTAITEDSIAALLTARYSFQDAALRSFYGEGTSATSDGFAQVDLPQNRAGLLSRGGFLIMEGFDQTSPVLRGLFIREKFLCGELPPPPEFVDNVPSEPTDVDTTRARADAHASDPQCKGCHQFMDPIGFGFERFDATGRWRETEAGQPIDDRGDVIASDIGTFRGAAELGAKLANSDFFRACFVRQWFRFATGRLESRNDLATLQSLADVAKSTGSYRAIQLALTQTDAFLYRPTEDTQ